MSSSIFWKLHFLDPPSHIQQHKQIDIMFRITNLTLMDRKYPNALAYIKIEAVIRVKQKLWAVKIWAKMIWKQPSSFSRSCMEIINLHSDQVNCVTITKKAATLPTEEGHWITTFLFFLAVIVYISRLYRFSKVSLLITAFDWIHIW